MLSKQQFEDLYGAHAHSLFRYLVILLGDIGKSEDVGAEFFLRTIHAHADFNLLMNKVFVFSQVRKLAQSMYPAEAARGLDKNLPTALGFTAEKSVLTDKELLSFKQEFITLPAKHKEIFDLRIWEGLSSAEVAQIVGMDAAQIDRALAADLDTIKTRVTAKLTGKSAYMIQGPLFISTVKTLAQLPEFRLRSGLYAEIFNKLRLEATVAKMQSNFDMTRAVEPSTVNVVQATVSKVRHSKLALVVIAVVVLVVVYLLTFV